MRSFVTCKRFRVDDYSVSVMLQSLESSIRGANICSTFTRYVRRTYVTDQVVQRAVRERPTERREAYLTADKIVRPQYMAECRGTPRREYSVNLIDGIRVKPTFNPYQKLTAERNRQLAVYKSRDWDNWDPFQCYVGLGGRRYQIPEDLLPTKDELGCWQGPMLSKRYVADIRKQYFMHGLPWVWDKSFYREKLHAADREPNLPRNRYTTNNRKLRVQKAIRRVENMKISYLREKKDARRYRWWERVILEFGGVQALEDYARVRKVPRLV